MPNAYAQLEECFATIADIQGAISVLHWDSATMMPNGGAETRGQQLSTLEAMAHAKITHPEIADLLDSAESDTSILNAWQQANLRQMRHRHLHASAVPPALLKAHVQAGSACEHLWRQARHENDFSQYAPALENVLTLTQEVAQAKAASLDTIPYEALLDQYDPGRKKQEIDRIFATLEEEIPPLLGTILESQKKPLPLVGPFPAKEQKNLAAELMQNFGFDTHHGRLDTSHHPFCGGTADDIRITTRYDEADFTTALMGVLHETGHAMYERGLPKEWRRQPVGDALGMSIHESQSLFVEMQICRSRAFAEYIAPLVARKFARENNPAYTAENLYLYATYVQPGLIRVDADEVTYPLHIILRYRLEQSLLAGTLPVRDLPEAWNEEMQSLLGITVPNDRDGCMQDIHWADGSIGYFPTYTLGAMTAAQLRESVNKALPDLDKQISRGEFAPLMGWLRQNIHQNSSLYDANTLLVRATGRTLEAAPFLNHLKERYLAN